MKSLPAILNALSTRATSAAVADAANSEIPAIGAPAASPELGRVAGEKKKEKDRGGGSLPNAAATEATKLRRLCRKCSALLKEMAASGQSSKRD